MPARNYTPLHQQVLAEHADMPEQGSKICAPTAFLNVLHYMGYHTDPVAFIKDLHSDTDHTLVHSEGWSRPALTRFVRLHEKKPTVSWRQDLRDSISSAHITAMQEAGYISDSQAEITYLLSAAHDTLEAVVAERPAYRNRKSWVCEKYSPPCNSSHTSRQRLGTNNRSRL